jgi:hypothetical protein
VHRVLAEFTDDVYLFDELRKDLEAFLAEEEKSAEATIQTSADEINQRDRQEIARVVSRSEIEKRLETHAVPNFLGSFLRDNWITTLVQSHLQDGEESEAWASALATLDDLVWSVQPKRTSEERRKLVAMLPNLLKRLHGGLQNVGWEAGERERFMGNLVEAHAAAVKPSLASMPMPTTAVAEAAAAAAAEAHAKGDVEMAAKARRAWPRRWRPGAAARADDRGGAGPFRRSSRRRSSAGCGSSSKARTVSSRSPSWRGSARCAAHIFSPTGRVRRQCRSPPTS